MTTRLHQGDAEQGERTPKGGGSSPVTHITDGRRAASLPFEQQLEEAQGLLEIGRASCRERV